ncbi:hypothetical protein NECAME_12143 [Necator americanus]|uniref:Aldehyde dehydrogenase domain-containing protein n=1 Tax=Necator americanus TaxID=51031 RepID=W2T3I9_NECAM|nr:hypothetical protein NECAME_12143 [Necator americanus]ETN75771.1 hypothetical protein NECAME_12143 [Necator americanus]
MLRTGLSRAAIQIRAASSIPPPIRNIKPEYTKMFINNEWVDAVSKKTYDTINPVDKSLIAKVAEGDKANVDKAVKVRPLDVLVDFAAKQAHIGNYTNQGQFCCGGTRVFVEGKVYDEFVARSKELAEKRVLGDPFDLKTEQGPQIFGPVMSILRFDTMEDLVDIANNTIYGLAGGVVTKDLDKALYVANNIRAGTVW